MGIIPFRLKRKEIDELSYFFIAFGMIFTIPQVLLIYQTQSAEDLSILSWLAYMASSGFWLIYGLERKLKPIIASSLAHGILNIVMIIGIMKFG